MKEDKVMRRVYPETITNFVSKTPFYEKDKKFGTVPGIPKPFDVLLDNKVFLINDGVLGVCTLKPFWVTTQEFLLGGYFIFFIYVQNLWKSE